MAARRIRPYEKYAKIRSRQKSRLSHFLVMLAAICALMLLVRSRIFVVREIEVTGNSTISAAEIAGLSGIRLGASIFSVEKSEIERNISADQYVELVDVDRKLPDTIVLEVRERTACAAVNCAGVILVIDDEGRILERREHVPDDPEIIVVSGMDVSVGAQSKKIESGVSGQTERMCRLLTAIRDAQAQTLVSELNLSDPDNLYLISHSGIQVLLGDENQIENKLVWMQTVLERLTESGKMRGVLDVSSGKNAAYSER